MRSSRIQPPTLWVPVLDRLIGNRGTVPPRVESYFTPVVSRSHGSAAEVTDKACEQFTSEKELAQLAADWPGPRLVDIWNRIPGLTPVKRFTNRAVATDPEFGSRY